MSDREHTEGLGCLLALAIVAAPFLAVDIGCSREPGPDLVVPVITKAYRAESNRTSAAWVLVVNVDGRTEEFHVSQEAWAGIEPGESVLVHPGRPGLISGYQWGRDVVGRAAPEGQPALKP